MAFQLDSSFSERWNVFFCFCTVSWNTQWWLTLNSAVTGSPLEHLPSCQLHCHLFYYYQDCKEDEITHIIYGSDQEHSWHVPWDEWRIQQLTSKSAVTGSPLEHLPACKLHCLLCHYHQDCKGDENIH